jgi:hypothetical protein
VILSPCSEKYLRAPLASATRLVERIQRFHKTILQEFYQVTFRKKLYRTLEELQEDLDAWLVTHNEQRTHQGKMCCGRTPLETLIDGCESGGRSASASTPRSFDPTDGHSQGDCQIKSRLLHV